MKTIVFLVVCLAIYVVNDIVVSYNLNKRISKLETKYECNTELNYGSNLLARVNALEGKFNVFEKVYFKEDQKEKEK